MLCKNPFSAGGTALFGCGQCLPCRVSRQRGWASRLAFESYSWDDATFVTLTYAEEFVPENLSLNIRDYQLFLKRLRYELNTPIKYYFVGEYGDKTHRPHYHAIMFGLSQQHQDLVQKCWSFGFVHCGEFNEQTCNYTCSYVLKKMTSKNDERLFGRFPEFCRQSNGLGLDFLEHIIQSMFSVGGRAYLAEFGDVPYQVRIGSKIHLLGRFLRCKLRDEVKKYVKFDYQEAIKKFSLEKSSEMIELYKTDRVYNYESFKSIYLRKSEAAFDAVECRVKLRKPKEM